jgi:hypothetical protein
MAVDAISSSLLNREKAVSVRVRVRARARVRV